MEILNVDTIQKYNDVCGFEIRHPQVAVVRFTGCENILSCRMTLGFYCLFLKQTKGCQIDYGKTRYDFDDQTVVAFGPGQTIGITSVEGVRPSSIGLLFHPDFIRGTALGQKIKQYSYFSYASNEALHLSAAEREVITHCFSVIEAELARPIDRHTRTIVCTNIELMLDYCLRFYDRQFVVRETLNGNIFSKFEEQLEEYFSKGVSEKNGLPSVSYFAKNACLSPNYFGDLVKKETGKTVKELINLKLLDFAKEELLKPTVSISQVAYKFGFQYPQHFVRFFKRLEGVTPKQFRTGA